MATGKSLEYDYDRLWHNVSRSAGSCRHKHCFAQIYNEEHEQDYTDKMEFNILFMILIDNMSLPSRNWQLHIKGILVPARCSTTFHLTACVACPALC